MRAFSKHNHLANGHFSTTQPPSSTNLEETHNSPRIQRSILQPASAMPTGFLSLPAEVRNEIYRYLLQSGTVSLDFVESIHKIIFEWKAKNGREIHTSILRVNKTIHHEARFLLYSQNHFSFDEDYEFEMVFGLFLKGIGSINTSYLQYLKIPFPYFEDIEYATTRGWRYDLIVEQIQNDCTNLRTIELYSASPMFSWEDLLRNFEDCHGFIAENFAKIDTRLREIQSLQEIRATTKGYPGADAVREMESRGWIFSDAWR